MKHWFLRCLGNRWCFAGAGRTGLAHHSPAAAITSGIGIQAVNTVVPAFKPGSQVVGLPLPRTDGDEGNASNRALHGALAS